MLATQNQCYHMTRAVLHVFRSHLDVADAITFASALPPVLCAIFVESWEPAPPAPFPDREGLQAEVMAIRSNHNVSTPSAISDVATALMRHVDPVRFQTVLDALPADARHYWVV